MKEDLKDELADDLINIAEAGLVTVFAVFLHKFKHLWEPYLTWLEVVAGFFICWRFTKPRLAPVITRDEAMRQMWRSFVYGGAPIVAWQVWLGIRMVINEWRERRTRQ